jgi:hypothetical protein
MLMVSQYTPTTKCASANNHARRAAINALGARHTQCTSQAIVINSSGLSAQAGRGSGAKLKACAAPASSKPSVKRHFNHHASTL